MLFKNSQTRYGFIAILFHWLMAVLIIALLALGLYMINLPKGLEKTTLYGWHKEYGFLVLILVNLRFIWRLANKMPRLSMPLFQQIMAKLVHWALYLFMFAMPISGWLISSAAGVRVSFFGLFSLPNLIPPKLELVSLFKMAHEWFAYSLIAIIILHTLAAFKHHLIDKDDILTRILPIK